MFSLRKSQQSLNIHEEFKQKSKTIHTQKYSDQLFGQKKYRAFENIFKAMDKDEDKLITYRTISLNFISENLRKILNPIVLKLKEDQCSMNQKEFINYCDNIYEVIFLIIRARQLKKNKFC